MADRKAPAKMATNPEMQELQGQEKSFMERLRESKLAIIAAFGIALGSLADNAYAGLGDRPKSDFTQGSDASQQTLVNAQKKGQQIAGERQQIAQRQEALDAKGKTLDAKSEIRAKIDAIYKELAQKGLTRKQKEILVAKLEKLGEEYKKESCEIKKEFKNGKRIDVAQCDASTEKILLEIQRTKALELASTDDFVQVASK